MCIRDRLDDALTQVCLYHVNAVLLQIRIHLALLGAVSYTHLDVYKRQAMW